MTGTARRCLAGRAIALVVAVLLAAAPELSGAADPAGDSSPMRNEHVVQMLVGGQSVAAVLAAIEKRPPDFDVSPEMIEELRLAGVPAEVIEAMRRRQAAVAPPEPAPAEPAATPSLVRLRVSLEPGKLELGTALTDPQRRALEIVDRTAQVEDLAVFLGCTTATHVPDHWRSQSPLGRDFGGIPRHQMLAFQPGATRDGASVVLTLPAALEAQVEPGTHDLWIGVAARIGGTYRTLSTASRVGVEVGETGRDLLARLSLARGKGANAQFAPDDEVAKDSTKPLDVRQGHLATGAVMPRGPVEDRRYVESPDGSFRLVFDSGQVWLDRSHVRVALGPLPPSPDALEILWGTPPDLLALHGSEAGAIRLRVWRLAQGQVVSVDLTSLGEAFAPCPIGDLVALAWTEPDRLLVARRGASPPACGAPALSGVLLNTATAGVVNRYSTLDMEGRFSRLLGPGLSGR